MRTVPALSVTAKRSAPFERFIKKKGRAATVVASNNMAFAEFQAALDLYQKLTEPRLAGTRGVATASIVVVDVLLVKVAPRHSFPPATLAALAVVREAFCRFPEVSLTSPTVPVQLLSSKRYSALFPANWLAGYQRMAVPKVVSMKFWLYAYCV